MKSKQLFTKWDLVVVLCCVGFIFLNLAAIGIRGRSNVRNMLCANNIKEQVRAQLLFGADNDGKFPTNAVEYPTRPRYRNASGGLSNGLPDWYGALKRSVYLPESKIMLCPVQKTKYTSGAAADLSWLDGTYNYGAWDWDKNKLASGIPAGQTPGDIIMGYAWFANWTTSNPSAKMVFNFTWTEPAPIGKTWNVNTEPFPKTLNDCKSNNAMITHLVWYNDGGPSVGRYDDLSHQNGKSSPTPAEFAANNASQVHPVGYGDGHVSVVPKNKIEPRAHVMVGSSRPRVVYY